MKKHRAWQRMLSGRRLDLLDPTPLDIEIEDIAHGLSFVARWNGQTSGNFPYSVAEHSLLVEQIFSKSFKKSEKKWCLAALLHDAPEYVIGDMISPVKSTIGIGYQSLENRLTSAINLRFGLPTKIPDNVKKSLKIHPVKFVDEVFAIALKVKPVKSKITKKTSSVSSKKSKIPRKPLPH